MVELQCKECNYRFVLKGKIPKRCPYCDKKGTLQKAKQMQDWIDEVVTESEHVSLRR